MNIKRKGLFTLILWYIPVFLVQSIGGLITEPSLTPWYRSLQKASWNPPAWVFGPTWTLLYILMAVSVWLVYRTPSSKKAHRKAYALFFAQLFFNGLWSLFFFGMQNPGLALIDLIILLTLIIATTLAFYRIRRLAAYLMLPYLAWSLYALTLNFAIWWKN